MKVASQWIEECRMRFESGKEASKGLKGNQALKSVAKQKLGRQPDEVGQFPVTEMERGN